MFRLVGGLTSLVLSLAFATPRGLSKWIFFEPEIPEKLKNVE